MMSDTIEEEWELVFHEQDDGRRVSRLPSGKVVLVDLAERDRVQDGELWQVRVLHHDAYAIAHLIDLVTDTPGPDVAARRLDGPEEMAEEEMLDVVVRSRGTAEPRARERREPREAAHWVAKPDEVIRPGERVAVFIDGASADQACREAGFWFDYVRLLQWARGAGTLHGGYYYAPDRRGELESQQQRFLDLLTHNGFIVHVKQPRRDARTSFSTEMAIDALDAARSFEVAWFVGNDPDLTRLADVLRARGKRVYSLYSDGALSRELGAVVNKPLFHLEDHVADLERRAPAPQRENGVSSASDEEE